MDDLSESTLGRWMAPNCPLAIRYVPSVLDRLREEARNAFSDPDGSYEIGGLLLGHRRGRMVVITASSPVDCEYAAGPSFVLSQRDKRRLFEAIVLINKDARSHPVGWYRSQIGAQICLSKADIEIYRQFFPEAWQVALVLQPDGAEAVKAGFFYWESGGGVQSHASRQEFVVDRLPPLRLPRPENADQEANEPAPTSDAAERPAPSGAEDTGAAPPLSFDGAENRRAEANGQVATPAGPAAQAPALAANDSTDETTAESISTEAGAPAVAPNETPPQDPPAPELSPVAATEVASHPPESSTAPEPPAPAGATTPEPRVGVPPAPPPEAPPLPRQDTASMTSDPTDLGTSNRRRWSLPQTGILAALILALTVGALYYRQRRVWSADPDAATVSTSPPDSIRLVTIDQDGQLQVLWDPSPAAIQQSTGGELQITDGGLSQSFDLDPVHLQTGSFTYARHSDRIQAVLKVHRAGKTSLVQATTYIGRPATERTEPDRLWQEREALAKEVDQLKSELATEAARARELEKALADLRTKRPGKSPK